MFASLGYFSFLSNAHPYGKYKAGFGFPLIAVAYATDCS